MIALKTINDDIKMRADEVVAKFNKEVIDDPEVYYNTRYKGRFLYLDRYEHGLVSHICRLTYTDNFNEWEFAIYKYSDELYAPEECIFPGDQYVDGTIEGAMKAGLEAYPV